MESKFGGSMAVREAEVRDVAGIVELSGALFREDAGSRDASMNLGWPEEEGREYFSALVSDRNCVCLVAESGGEMVGYLAGRMEKGDSLRPVKMAELESMYVREVFRSGGVGAGLAAEFLRWAAGEGAERVSVTAYAANGRAISFYGNLGFCPMRLSLEMEL
jgi:ribosomal protein S18 acetylase RimI-like enzyme